MDKVDIFENLSQDERAEVEKFLKLDKESIKNFKWFNENTMALTYLDDMLKVANKYPNSCNILENEANNEVFISIDSDDDGRFDRNITYINGKKTLEAIDRDDDFNNELVLKYDNDGKIKSGAIDEDDDGLENLIFSKEFKKFNKNFT